MNDSVATSALSSYDLELLMSTAEHINDEHGDAVAFVARFAGSWPQVREAAIVGVDETGVTFDIAEDDGTRERRKLDFDRGLTTVESVQMAVNQLLHDARTAAPVSTPLTSMEQEMAEMATLPTFHTTVARVRNVNPRYREITFAGGLEEFTPRSPDQFMLVILPSTGGSEPRRAYYTVRRWRPDEGELDIWFVLHDHHGPLSGWAAGAKPGDVVSLWGPRTSFDPPRGTSSLLLVADDTGVPAVAAILEQVDLPARVIVETYDADPVVDLPLRAGIDVERLYRDGDEPGASGRLVEAVRNLDLNVDGLYAYGAGESREITAVRKHLRRERGMGREAVQMVGYWRRSSPPST